MLETKKVCDPVSHTSDASKDNVPETLTSESSDPVK